MSVKILKPHQKPFIKPIKVFEPFKTDDVITFETPDEFTTYYRTHEDDFQGISTVLLNRKYKIPGYRISQKKRKNDDEPQELSLKKDYYGGKQALEHVKTIDDNTLDEVIERITKLEETVINLSKELNNIIKYLQENN